MITRRFFSIQVVALAFFIFFGFLSQSFAAQEVMINEIIQNPAKYYNLPVKIKGVVVNVTPSQQLRSGFYTIRDESEATIEVKTNDLPGPGRTFTIEGIVTMKAETQTPYLKEMSRSKVSLLPYLVIGAAVVVLILIGILVYLLFKPARREPGYVPVRMREPTRPVKAEDMKRVGPEKTIEVPSIPAQLEVLNGPKKGEKYILKRGNIIGRDDGDLTLGDPTVSAEHAQIVFMDKKYFLVNKSLTNPTKINKEAVKGEQELKDNDEIIMGAIRLKYNLL